MRNRLGLLLWVLTCSALPVACADYPRLEKIAPGALLETSGRGLVTMGTSSRSVFPPGLSLTKREEGFVGHLYDDAAGYCTIGYGHLVQTLACSRAQIPPEFKMGITEGDGSNLLVGDLNVAERGVTTYVAVTLSDPQYAALCDFVFNVGSRNFAGSSLLREVNAKRFFNVPDELRRWRLANGRVLEDLVQRREHEIALFFAGAPIPEGRGLKDQSPIDIRSGEQK